MELLSGWKEIADHLHLGVRTAQRWERLGLPVRRVSDSPCSPVVALPDELELWARTRDVKADAALLASNRLLVARLTELRDTQNRTRRKTRKLLAQLACLGNEQKKLIFDIRSNLAHPLRQGAENDTIRNYEGALGQNLDETASGKLRDRLTD
jgi:hypothetical protein